MLSTSTFLTFLLIFTRYSITSALDLCDPADAFQLSETSNGFTVTLKDREVLKHPFLYVGEGETDYREFHGDFFQKDYLEYKTPLNNFEIVHGDRKNENSSDFVVILDGVYEARFFCSQKDSVQEIKVVKVDESSAVNRVWVRFIKQQDEKFFGGGQQYINLDLNGHVTPLLVQDKVVGNNILTNLIGKYTSKEITYWPAPIFTSNKKYWMSLEATELLILDMSQDEFFEIEIFAENSNSIFFSQQFDNYGLLMNDMSSKLGRKEDIPDWIVEGSVIGLQGGSEIVMDRYREGRRKGAEITGVWIQDWSGQVNTGFGDRVNWNWEWNETYYPTLREDVEELKKDGAYFLVYMNPHLLQNSSTFNSAQHANVLIKQRDDPSKPIIQGFGSGFDCGTVDLTTEKGRNWYKTEIIFKALDLGIRGWMADFGEYVPLDKSEIILDCELEENSECSAENVHNEFPTLYAQVNFDAVNEYFHGDHSQVFIFHRSGFTKSNKYALSAWTGDQTVTWNHDLGLPSAITASLSLGMSGYPYIHSDIGGYQSILPEIKRDQNLLLRWAEMNIFSTAMRSHEGNRPDGNSQLYDSDGTWSSFARLTKIRKELSEYTSEVVRAAQSFGWPVMRPLFFHYPNDAGVFDCTINPILPIYCPFKFQYMFGHELLVAPMITESDTQRIYFPHDDTQSEEGNTWVNLWDKSDVVVSVKNSLKNQKIKTSLLGEPLVYYRNFSQWHDFFLDFQKFKLVDICDNKLSWAMSDSISSDGKVITQIKLGDVVIFEHSLDNPMLSVGDTDVKFTETGSNGGNFVIDRSIATKMALSGDVVLHSDVVNDNGHVIGKSYEISGQRFDLTCGYESTSPKLHLHRDSGNTFYLRSASTTQQYPVLGGGEQYNYFDLRGRDFNIFVNEQGVGRGENLVSLAQKSDGNTGQYDTSYWPLPVLVGQSGDADFFWMKYEGSDYTRINLVAPASDFEIYSEEKTSTLSFGISDDQESITQNLKEVNEWNQQKLPDWAVSSSIIGLQGGTDRVLQVYNVMKDAGVEKINGIWIQDWSGQIVTDFGKRVFWNWKWDEDRYPGLDKVIKDLKEKDDTLFLVYMNPHLNVLGDLFVQAENDGALIKYHNEVTGKSETFKQDFGEFLCGTVDLTSSHGRNWYRDNIINPALDLGIRGWMADFGEYLPLDENIILADGRKAKQVHNDFPALWAQVNYEAIDAYGLNSEDVFLFYRAGYTNSNKYAQSAWAGDQTVDWSESDGLASTIPAALSLGASGLSVTHIDIGLYTSLVGQEVDGYKFNVIRCKELLLRSAEMAVFSPVMRTHEGNRPDENWQVYQDENTIRRYKRLTEIHAYLTPYINQVLLEAYDIKQAKPAQRSVCFYWRDIQSSGITCDDLKYQYMFGSDLLVAPVLKPSHQSKIAYLPVGETWVHIWTGEEYMSSETVPWVEVDAGVGNIPVFYNKKSSFSELFEGLLEWKENEVFEEMCVDDEPGWPTDSPTDSPITQSSGFLFTMNLFMVTLAFFMK